MRGIALGLSVTGAQDISGFGTGIFGVGAGRNFTGLGAGVGGRLTGLAAGIIGVGAGGQATGVLIGGIGVGAHRIHGGVLTEGMLCIENGGTFRGGAVTGAGTMIKGTQQGVAIGLVNYARSVDGIQIGLINIIDSHRSHRILPIANWQD